MINHRTFPLTRRATAILLALALILTLAPSAAAQSTPPPPSDNGLRMQAVPLFDGNYKYGEWLPVWIEIENNGPDVNAEVRILVPTNAGTMVYTTPAELPTTSRKRFQVYVLPNNFSRQLRTELVADGKTLASLNIPVRPNPTAMYIVGLVAPQRDALALISNAHLPGSIERQKVLIDMDLDDLPERYEGLRSFDLLVLNNVDTSTLNPQQTQALKTWVEQGGRLVIGGGADAGKTIAGLPAELPMFEVNGARDVRSLPGLEDYVAQDGSEARPVRVPGPFVIATGNLRNGSVLAEQDGLPLVVEYNAGLGHVDFVALDLGASPFDAWNGTTPFWEFLIGPGAEYPTWLPVDISIRQQNASNMPYALSNLPVLDLPSTGGLALLLGIYIVLVGPVNYLVLRWQKRLHLAWITIPSITLVFTLASFALGYALHGTDVFINKIAIIQPQSGGRAHVESYIGIFSPAQTSYEVEIEGGGLVSPLSIYQDPWQSFSGSTGPGRGMTLVQGDPAYVRGLSVDQWSMQNFMVEDLSMDFGEVAADLQIENDALEGQVHNNSPYDLQDAVLVMGNNFTRLGDLPAGASADVELSFTDFNQNDMWGPPISYRIFQDQMSGSTSRQAEVRRMIAESLLERSPQFVAAISPKLMPPGGPSASNQAPVLLGWVDQAPPQVGVAGELPSQQVTAAVFMPLNYRFPEAGMITLPVGQIPGVLIEMPAQGGSCGSSRTTSIYLPSGQATFEYSLPQFALDLQADSLKLSIWNDSNWATMPDISFYDWQTRQWIGMQGVETGMNLIPDASAYISPSGHIRLRLEGSGLQGCYYLALGAEGRLVK